VFGIFDLAYPKIVDPTIFVRESFIFAENFLARRVGARRAPLFRPSPPILSRVAAWSTSTLSPGRRDPIEATVPGCTAASRSQGKKKATRRKKEVARGGKKIVACGEESFRGKLPRRGEYGHDKESKILRISKLPSHCAYAKMPSLVH